MAKTTYKLNLWQSVCYYTLFGIVYAVSLLPLRVLYVLSDFIYVLACHVIRYRRKLVRRHIADSFPEHSPAEHRRIEHDFYRWFADYIVETIKLFSMSREEMRRRLRFEGADILEHCIDQHRDVVLCLGHYCNWEWVSSIPLWIGRPAETYAGSQVYHVLESPVMDRLLLYPRHRMGPDNVAMSAVLRYIVANRKAGRPVIMGFIADQVPFWNNIGHWLTFLNHPDTPVLTGPEKLARRYDMACVYIDLRRPSRGCYEARFELMTDSPASMPANAITEDYYRRLEQSIRRQPHLYLWTHNRWKRTRQEYDSMIDPATGRLKF